MWSGLVSQCFFWGDEYASKIEIDLVRAESSIAQYITLQKMRLGTAWKKENMGFDTVCKLIDRGDLDAAILCCRVRVDLPTACTENELKRTGERLLQIMPETVRGPIMFSPPPPLSTAASSAVDTESILTKNQQSLSCLYYMCEEKVAIPTTLGRRDGFVAPPPVLMVSASGKVPAAQYIRDDDDDVDGVVRKEYFLYKSDGGMVWNLV